MSCADAACMHGQNTTLVTFFLFLLTPCLIHARLSRAYRHSHCYPLDSVHQKFWSFFLGPTINLRNNFNHHHLAKLFIVTIYLINKRHGSRILKEIASRANHTSYRKVYFNEFVQNSLGCDMGMIIFDLHGGC